MKFSVWVRSRRGLVQHVITAESAQAAGQRAEGAHPQGVVVAVTDARRFFHHGCAADLAKVRKARAA